MTKNKSKEPSESSILTLGFNCRYDSDDEEGSSEDFDRIFGHWVASSEQFRQCSFCPTEYVAARGWSTRSGCPCVRIMVYHNFGNGKRPGSDVWGCENVHWSHLVGTGPGGNALPFRFINFPARSIMDAFEKGDPSRVDIIS